MLPEDLHRDLQPLFQYDCEVASQDQAENNGVGMFANVILK